MEVWIALAIVKCYIRPQICPSTNDNAASQAVTSPNTSPVDTFESLLKAMQKLAGKMKSKDLLKHSLLLHRKFVEIVQPPLLEISTQFACQHRKPESGEWDGYWRLGDDVPEGMDDLLRLDVSRQKLISDVKMSVDEALTTLNTRLSC